MNPESIKYRVTYTTVTPLTVVANMVEPGVPPNAGLFFTIRKGEETDGEGT